MSQLAQNFCRRSILSGVPTLDSRLSRRSCPRFRGLVMLAITGTLFTAITAQSAYAGNQYYVSPTGSASNPGTEERPVIYPLRSLPPGHQPDPAIRSGCVAECTRETSGAR